MTLTPAQLEDRRSRIGASEVAAIVDWDRSLRDPAHVRIDPFKVASAVWASKVLGVDDTAGPAAELGNYLESGILRWSEDRLGLPLLRNAEYRSPSPLLVSLPDGVIAMPADDGDHPLDAKTSSLGPWLSPLHEQWGDDGSDQVPRPYWLQVQAQMACTGGEVGYIAAMIGRLSPNMRMYRIERHQGVIDYLLEVVERFWKQHVETKKPPEGEPPPLDLMKRVKREGPSVAVEDDVMREVVAAKLALKEAKEREEKAKARLLMVMGPAARATSNVGEAVIKIKKRKPTVVAASEWAELSIKGIDDGE